MKLLFNLNQRKLVISMLNILTYLVLRSARFKLQKEQPFSQILGFLLRLICCLTHASAVRGVRSLNEAKVLAIKKKSIQSQYQTYKKWHKWLKFVDFFSKLTRPEKAETCVETPSGSVNSRNMYMYICIHTRTGISN